MKWRSHVFDHLQKKGPRADGSRLDAFFTSAPAGLVILDSSLRLLKANDTMADMIGSPLESIIGQTPGTLVPLLAPIVEPILLGVGETGQPALNFPLSGETPKAPGVVRHWLASVFPVLRDPGNKWTIGVIAVEVTDRVKFEEVCKSEALLSEAERLADLGSWEHDLIAGRETWSPNLCRILGLDAATRVFPQRTFLNFVHPDDLAMARSTIEWGMKDRQAYEYQARFVLPSGHQRILFTRGQPIVDSNDRIVKTIGVTQDITADVEAQRALLASEERYRDLVEHSQDLICTHDLEGRLLSVNDPPARILGYRREDLVGRRIVDALRPDVRGQFAEYIERIVRDGYAKGLMVLATRSGEERIWEYENTLRTEGVPAPIVRGRARDVTEQVNAQRALRDSKARLQALVNSIDEIVFEFDAAGTFLDMWTTRETLLCRPRAELLGRRISDVLGEEFSTPFREMFWRVLKTGLGEDLEYTLEVQEGKRWFLGHATPIKAPDGAYKTICLVVRDITQRKDAEETLRLKETTIRGLLRISNSLNAKLDVSAILSSLVQEAMVLGDAEGGRSATFGPEGLVGNCFFHQKNTGPSPITWDLQADAMSLVAQSKLPYLSNDALNDPHVSPASREALNLRHVLLTPVFDSRGEVIAVFGVHNKKDGKGFTATDQENMTGLAAIAGIALQNALAYSRIRAGEAELRTLSTRLLSLQDEERRRIALELHESTAQALAGLLLALGPLKRLAAPMSDSLRKVVDEIGALGRQIVHEIRTLSYALHPPQLEAMGLVGAVVWYAEGFAERSGIKVDVDVPEDIGRLPAEEERTLFRVVQECLTNVHRHSHSPSATIRFTRDASSVSVTVADSGKGMTGSSAARLGQGAKLGVGISGMRERVKQLHGTLEIENAPGKGVTVHIVLPLAAKELSEDRRGHENRANVSHSAGG